jgi:hypothetical protein
MCLASQIGVAKERALHLFDFDYYTFLQRKCGEKA